MTLNAKVAALNMSLTALGFTALITLRALRKAYGTTE